MNAAMLYAIIARDIPGSVKARAETRPRHIAYLKALIDEVEGKPFIQVAP